MIGHRLFVAEAEGACPKTPRNPIAVDGFGILKTVDFWTALNLLSLPACHSVTGFVEDELVLGDIDGVGSGMARAIDISLDLNLNLVFTDVIL